MKPMMGYRMSALTVLSRFQSELEMPAATAQRITEYVRIQRNIAHHYGQVVITTLADAIFRFLVKMRPEQNWKDESALKSALEHMETLIITADDSAPVLNCPAETSSCIRSLDKTSDNRPDAKEFFLRLRPSPEAFLRGLDVLSALEKISALGVADIQAVVTGLPPLSEMDPEKCYLEWEIKLRTEADINAIRDTLIFLESDEGGEVELTEITPAPVAQDEPQVPVVTPVTPPREEKMDSAPQTEQKIVKIPTAETSVARDESLSTIRVDSVKLDQIVNLTGEMVTAQSRLSQIASRLAVPELEVISEELERLTSDLRTQSMNLRMLPVLLLFKRYVRLVHDLGRETGKKVDISFEGEETELDKTVIEKLHNPLIHLIRNSVDHGLETPEARKAAGKDETGHITLEAFQSGPDVVIRIKDDGAGVDLDRVRSKAIQQGLMQEGDAPTEKQLLHMLFAPGFSTAEKISDLSGRGVGMDVVKSNIESLRGSVDISSRPGQGTTVTLKLPLTLAIIDGLLVRAGGELFIIPLSNVEECIAFREDEASKARRVINLRDEAVPYVVLERFFELAGDEHRADILVVLRDEEEGRVGFVVNAIVGQHQTVIKPLGSLYRERSEFSGATILGDGTLALILDPGRLVKQAFGKK